MGDTEVIGNEIADEFSEKIETAGDIGISIGTDTVQVENETYRGQVDKNNVQANEQDLSENKETIELRISGENTTENIQPKQVEETAEDDEFDFDEDLVAQIYNQTTNESAKPPSEESSHALVVDGVNTIDVSSKITLDSGENPEETKQSEGTEKTDQDALQTRKDHLKEGQDASFHCRSPRANINCEIEEDKSHTQEKPRNAKTDYEKAVVEWENLEEIEAAHEGDKSVVSPKLTFHEALQHFESVDMRSYADKIKPTIKRSRVSSFFHHVINGGKLHKSLVAERNLIFTLAAVQFDNADTVHLQILQTIFKTLTKRKIDCPRFGTHWELVGFQGNDPATDLRGCGMLSLLTTLRFVTSPETRALSRQAYELSRDEVQNFPFSVMSINVTRMCLQILREGKLNKECNHRLKTKTKSYNKGFDEIVFDVLQEIYIAIFHRIFTIWKNGAKTMADSGFVVRDVEDYAKEKPIDLMKKWQKIRSKGQVSNDSTDTKIESFVGVDEL